MSIEDEIKEILKRKVTIKGNTTNGDAYLKYSLEQFTIDALVALYQKWALEVIGEDETIDGSSLANQIALSCNELRAEQRKRLQSAILEDKER